MGERRDRAASFSDIQRFTAMRESAAKRQRGIVVDSPKRRAYESLTSPLQDVVSNGGSIIMDSNGGITIRDHLS